MSTELLKFYFNNDQPFGPIKSPDIDSPEVFSSTFSRSNLIYHEISPRISMIVGRRGSGKTAFLRHIIPDPSFQAIVDLKPEMAFREVITSIESFSSEIVIVEETSVIWKVLFWSSLFLELTLLDSDNDPRIETLSNYLAGANIDTKKGPHDAIRRIISIIKDAAEKQTLRIAADLVDEFALNNVPFSVAKSAAIGFMQSHNIKAAILLDTLEEFQIERATMSHAIAGLLHCQGSFAEPDVPVELKICIPAEMYHLFLKIASNPGKDLFSYRILLHWHAMELIKLACHRYLTFLKLYDLESYKRFSHLDLDEKDDAIRFWNSIFPREITNRLDMVEDSTAYILRHTQLQPRHLLMLLNRIAIINIKIGGSLTSIPEHAMIEGVYNVETDIRDEIIGSFKNRHPAADDVCNRCIKYLPLYFSYGEFHRVFNIHGKKKGGTMDFYNFLDLMTEIGAVGRVLTKRETERYVVGEFEYALPHHINVSSEDKLCIHPVFSAVYSAIIPDDTKVVYPYGTDINELEYRKIL